MDETLIRAFHYLRLADLHMPSFHLSQTLRFTAIGVTDFVFKHPGVKEFLQEMARRYELALWTAGAQVWVEPIVNRLDLEQNIFSKRMYRTECNPSACQTLQTDGRCIKNLTRIGVDNLSREDMLCTPAYKCCVNFRL